MLVAEKDDPAIVEGILDRGEVGVGQRASQVNAADFGAQSGPG